MIARVLILFVVLAVTAGGGFYYWTTTPQYAVREVQQAVKAHNTEAFHNWVDVQSVAQYGVDDVLSEPVRNVGGGGLLERLLGFGVLTVLRPTVVNKVAHQIDTSVAQYGMDADQAPAPDQPKTLLGELVAAIKPPSLTEVLRDYGFTKANYRGLGDVRTEGNNAEVGLRFFIPKLQAEQQVHLLLNNTSGHWRIIRIANLQEIVRGIIGS